MQRQSEPICEQRLEHYSNLMRARSGARLCLNIVPLGLSPRWTARNLIIPDFVGLHDENLQRAIGGETLRTDSEWQRTASGRWA